MTSIDKILRSDFMHALGWTMVHAIWQLAAIALLLMLVLGLFRRKPAIFKYWAALLSMVAAVSVSVITFMLSYQQATSSFVDVSTLETSTIIAEQVQISFAQQIGLFFGQNLHLIEFFWLMGVLLLSFRLMLGFWQLDKLKKSGLPVDVIWSQRTKVLAKRFGIEKSIRLFESGMVKVPMMLGHLKPIILVPIGMLSSLPVEQVEAVLAHELAHIKRNDYLINLLQSVAEVAFFFHPGIWWISSIVRRERELCCDSEAMKVIENPTVLAFALSEVGEKFGDYQLSMAFNGHQKDSLLNRIKHILGVQEIAHPVRVLPATVWSFIVLAGLLTLGAGKVISAQDRANGSKMPITDIIAASLMPDTVKKDTVKTKEHHNVIISTDRKGKVKSVEMDGKRIPESEWDDEALGEAIQRAGAIQPPKTPIVPPAPDFELSEMPKIPLPPAPKFKKSGAWKDAMEDLGTAMGHLGEALTFRTADSTYIFDADEINEKKFKLDDESMKGFEKAMESFGKAMENWGETYGKEMEAWAEANEPAFEEYGKKMELWAKRNEPKLKEYGKKVEKWQKENEPQMKAFKKKMEKWEKEHGKEMEELERKMEELSEKRERLQEQRMEELERYLDEQGNNNNNE